MTSPNEVRLTAATVNQENEARVITDEVVEIWRRAFANTAGASNAIDQTHGILGAGGEYGLGYVAPKRAWAPTLGTAAHYYYDPNVENDPRVDDWSNPFMQISPLDLGGGISIIGGQPNAESVIEHFMPTRSIPVNVDPISTYRTTRRAAADARRDALAHISKDLDAAAAGYAQSAPQEVIRRLTDHGVSQLVIARALGVTPTAVRKWRRGESAKADHRSRLARFAATHSLLTETGLHDPAGWLDIPISSESTVTPLDLFVGGRADLSVLLGSRLMEPQEALDAYAPGWRQTYPVDADYEVVVLRDGSRSAVPRKRGGTS